MVLVLLFPTDHNTHLKVKGLPQTLKCTLCSKSRHYQYLSTLSRQENYYTLPISSKSLLIQKPINQTAKVNDLWSYHQNKPQNNFSTNIMHIKNTAAMTTFDEISPTLFLEVNRKTNKKPKYSEASSLQRELSLLMHHCTQPVPG